MRLLPFSWFSMRLGVINSFLGVCFTMVQKKIFRSEKFYKILTKIPHNIKQYLGKNALLLQYICDTAQVWGGPRATEHTKECFLPRRPGC